MEVLQLEPSISEMNSMLGESILLDNLWLDESQSSHEPSGPSPFRTGCQCHDNARIIKNTLW